MRAGGRPWALGALLVALAFAAAADAQETMPPFGVVPGDRVGERIVLIGDRIITGALGQAHLGGGGALLVVEHDARGWRLVRRIAIDAGAGPSADATLAATERGIAVGEFRYPEPVPGAGRVRVLEAGAGPRAELSITVPTRRIATLFGAAVAMTPELLVVGAPGDHVDGVRAGAAYVYERDGGAWKPAGRLTSPAPAFEAYLGQVAIAGDRILVGSPVEPGPERFRGVVYVFERSPAGSWELSQSLRARDGRGEVVFSAGFAAWQDWLAVSGYEADAAFVDLYRWQEGGYRRHQHLVVPGVLQATRFGSALQLRERILAVGAPGEARSAPASGGVYLFERAPGPAGEFRFAAFLGSPTAQVGDSFGRAIALDDARLVVGAPGTGGGRGAVYLYDVPRLLRSPPAVFEVLAPGLLSRAPATALAQDAQGTVWIGGRDEVALFDGIAVRRYRHDPADPTSLPGGTVLALHGASDGSTWVGTELGLARHDPVAGLFRRFAVPADGFPRTSFAALFEDRDGRLWAGSNGRLYRFDPVADRLVEERLSDDEPRQRDEAYIGGIGQDRSGRLWVLAKNLWENRAALYRFDPATQVTARFAVSAAWGQLGPMHIDPEDRLWLKAPASVALPTVSGSEVRPPGDVVSQAHWGFDRDGEGGLWIAHDGGYHAIDPASGEGVAEGTIAGQGVRGFLATRDGSLLAATTGGVFRRALSSAAADDLARERTERVVLRTVEIIGASGARRVLGSDLDVVSLAPDDVRLTLELAVPVFTDSGRVSLRYRMRDYDPGWIAADEAGVPSYTRMPPGSYVFEAEATVADPGLRVTVTPLSLRIEVAAPLHERVWFRLLLLAFAGAVGYGAWEVRTRQRREVRRLRRQIASDLHDDLSTNLSGMALAGRMLSRDGRLDENQREAIDRIVRTADSMGGDLRDIVWLVDPGRDSADDVASKMRRVARDLLGELECRLEIDGAALAGIDMADRRQLLLMYKECLHNIVRHASATRVEVSVRRTDGQLEMRIEDDGAGFDLREADGGHGLEGMRARARRLGARLDIDAEPGRGTRVRITFGRPGR